MFPYIKENILHRTFRNIEESQVLHLLSCAIAFLKYKLADSLIQAIPENLGEIITWLISVDLA